MEKKYVCHDYITKFIEKSRKKSNEQQSQGFVLCMEIIN